MIAWLVTLLPLIAHYSVGLGIMAGAVAAYIFVPVNLVKQIAIAVGVGTLLYLIGYSTGIRDELALWKSAEKATIEFAGKARDDAEATVPPIVGDPELPDGIEHLPTGKLVCHDKWDRDCR